MSATGWLVVVPLLWAGNILVIDAVLGDVPIVTAGALRWIIGVGVLIPLWSKKRPEPLPVVGRFWKEWILLGTGGIFGVTLLLFAALKLTSPLNAALISTANPVLVAAFSSLVLKEPFPAHRIVGLVLSLAGVLLVVMRGSLQALIALELNPGDLLMVANLIYFSLYVVAGKRMMGAFSSLTTTTFGALGSLILFIPLAFMERNMWSGTLFKLPPLAGLIYVGALGSGISLLGWNRAVQSVGPGVASGYLNLTPVFTALLGFVFLHQSIHWPHWVGGALVIGGLLITCCLPQSLALTGQKT